jgi:hypothetical protein
LKMSALPSKMMSLHSHTSRRFTCKHTTPFRCMNSWYKISIHVRPLFVKSTN